MAMKCLRCGAWMSDEKKFCTRCGAPLSAETVEMPAVGITGTPISPAQDKRVRPEVFAPPSTTPLVTKRSSKKVIVISILVAAVLVAVIAIFSWWILSGIGGTKAEIVSLELERVDGKELNLQKVPLDTKLSLIVTFEAFFGRGGKGKLIISIVSSDGSRIAERQYDLKSKKGHQVKSIEYSHDQGSGEPLEAKAKIEVWDDGKSKSDTDSIFYTAVRGKGEKLKLKEAKEGASLKLKEARQAVNEIWKMGIDTADLAERIDALSEKLDRVDSEAEANEVEREAQGVIDESEARKQSFLSEQARQKDEEACREVMLAYANANKGNAESVWLENFQMNDARTMASATVVGMVTVHTDPEHAGEIIRNTIVAEKQEGSWVITYYGMGE